MDKSKKLYADLRLPWRAEGAKIFARGNRVADCDYFESEGRCHANAALIVEAVNSHAHLVAQQDALVKALTDLAFVSRSYIGDMDEEALAALEAASDALTAAKVQP